MNVDVLYEDAEAIVVYPEKGVTEGHVKVYSKRDVKYLNDLPREIAIHLFKVAAMCASALFEGLGAQGTNIICNDGMQDQVCIDVISRTADDGVKINWEPKPANQNKLAEIGTKLKPHCEYLSADVKTEMPESLIDHDKQEEDSKSEVNYLIRSINRIP